MLLPAKSVIVLACLALAACYEPRGLEFKPTRDAISAVDELCNGNAESIPAVSIFESESRICNSDAPKGGGFALAVVLERRESKPDLPTAISLMTYGRVRDYEEMNWGLTSNGDVTFAVLEHFIKVGEAQVHVTSGYGVCLPVGELEVRRFSPRNGSACRLKLRNMERAR